MPRRICAAVTLRQVRIEVVFAGKDGPVVYVETERQSRAGPEFDHAMIKNRQRTRQTQTNRASVRIRLVAKPSRTATEDF